MKLTTTGLMLLVAVALLTCKKEDPCGCNGPNQKYVENVPAFITKEVGGRGVSFSFAGSLYFAHSACNPALAKPIIDSIPSNTHTKGIISGYIKIPCPLPPPVTPNLRITAPFEITEIRL